MSTVLITFTIITLFLATSNTLTIIASLITTVITSRRGADSAAVSTVGIHLPLPKIGHYKELHSPLFLSNPLHTDQKRKESLRHVIIEYLDPEGLSRIPQQKLAKSGSAYLKRNSECTSDTTYLEVHGP